MMTPRQLRAMALHCAATAARTVFNDDDLADAVEHEVSKSCLGLAEHERLLAAANAIVESATTLCRTYKAPAKEQPSSYRDPSNESDDSDIDRGIKRKLGI